MAGIEYVPRCEVCGSPLNTDLNLLAEKLEKLKDKAPDILKEIYLGYCAKCGKFYFNRRCLILTNWMVRKTGECKRISCQYYGSDRCISPAIAFAYQNLR